MKKLILPLAFCLLVVGFVSCDDASPTDPERMAELTITFEPNPVNRETDDTGQEEYKCVYIVRISEVNNVGVLLSEMIIQGKDLFTGQVVQEIKDTAFISSIFGTNRIRSGRSINSQFISHFTLPDDTAIVEVTFTVNGTDDNGNEVSTSATIQCQP